MQGLTLEQLFSVAHFQPARQKVTRIFLTLSALLNTSLHLKPLNQPLPVWAAVFRIYQWNKLKEGCRMWKEDLSWHLRSHTGKMMERVCVWLVFSGGGILGTQATTQCSVWISACFRVLLGRFCERGMMCIVWRERLSAEGWLVFIAGVRPTTIVMKAGPQPRSSACAVACQALPTVFVYKSADVIVLACVWMCLRSVWLSTWCTVCSMK